MRTDYADSFDARPRQGTGANKTAAMLAQLNDKNGAPFAGAVAVAGSHIAELAKRMQRYSGLVNYDNVNPASQWGRATVEARKMDIQLDPRNVTRVTRLS